MALGCSKCEATLRLVVGDEITDPTIRASNPMRGMPRTRFSVDYYIHRHNCECGMEHIIHVICSKHTDWKEIVQKHIHKRTEEAI